MDVDILGSYWIFIGTKCENLSRTWYTYSFFLFIFLDSLRLMAFLLTRWSLVCNSRWNFLANSKDLNFSHFVGSYHIFSPSCHHVLLSGVGSMESR